MSMGGQGTKWRRNIAEIFNRLSRAHERYRQTTDRRQTDRQTDGRRHIANLNLSSRSLKTLYWKMTRMSVKPHVHMTIRILIGGSGQLHLKRRT